MLRRISTRGVVADLKHDGYQILVPDPLTDRIDTHAGRVLDECHRGRAIDIEYRFGANQAIRREQRTKLGRIAMRGRHMFTGTEQRRAVLGVAELVQPMLSPCLFQVVEPNLMSPDYTTLNMYCNVNAYSTYNADYEA